MKASTHRVVQLSQLAERAWNGAAQCRRAACNAANANMKGAAIMLTRRAGQFHSVYLAAIRRLVLANQTGGK
jgi:hypothetical protein